MCKHKTLGRSPAVSSHINVRAHDSSLLLSLRGPSGIILSPSPVHIRPQPLRLVHFVSRIFVVTCSPTYLFVRLACMENIKTHLATYRHNTETGSVGPPGEDQNEREKKKVHKTRRRAVQKERNKNICLKHGAGR